MQKEMNSLIQDISDISFSKFATKNGNIVIFDYICGSGKSTLFMKSVKDYISDTPEAKFIIVLKYLDELDRYNLEFPTFFIPEKSNIFRTKTESYEWALKEGRFILMTHDLYKKQSKKSLKYLSNYYVVIDEEIETMSQIDMFSKDFEVYKDRGNIIIDEETRNIKWVDIDRDKIEINNETSSGTLVNAYNNMINGNTYCTFSYNKSKKLSVTNVGMMDKNLFMEPIKVFILTYGFKSLYLKCYFDIMKINYRYLKSEEMELRQSEIVKSVKNNITILPHLCDSLRNHKIDKQHDSLLSDSSFSVNSLSKIKSKSYISTNTRSYYNGMEYRYLKSNNINVSKVAIICPNDLCEKGLSKSGKYKNQKGLLTRGLNKNDNFVAYNARATNEHKDKDFVLLKYNIYQNYPMKLFLNKMNCTSINDKDFTLNILIQLIFRFAIRDGNHITILSGSKRMSEILQDWIDNI